MLFCSEIVAIEMCQNILYRKPVYIEEMFGQGILT